MKCSPEPEPEPEPYPDFAFAFDYDRIKAHAKDLPPAERSKYLHYVHDKWADSDRETIRDLAETLYAERYLSMHLLYDLVCEEKPFEVALSHPLDETAEEDLEDLEEYVRSAHDRAGQIRILQGDAENDLEEYLYDRHWNQWFRGLISDLSEEGDDYLVFGLEEELDIERAITRALDIQRPLVSARLFGGRRGPSPLHNHENLWANSVTACLGILKSRRESADPVPEKVSVEEFAGEMQPPIDKATWHKHAKFARKPDSTVGITAKGCSEGSIPQTRRRNSRGMIPIRRLYEARHIRPLRKIYPKTHPTPQALLCATS